MNLNLLIVAMFVAIGPVWGVAAKLNVVATLPDSAAIARAIVGDVGTVTCLAQGSEDPHFVAPRPSYIRTLNRADVLIEGGADLEIGWLPPLVSGARNSKIRPGAKGRISTAKGLRLLDVSTGPIDRSAGHVHAAGNPHFLMDPLRGKVVAQNITIRLSRIDPSNASKYRSNLDKFVKRLDAKLKEWSERMSGHKGIAFVSYHKTFDYFAERYGLVVVGQLEPKPGVSPTPAHVKALVPKAKAESVKIVVIGSFRSRRMADYLAKLTEASVLVLPVMPMDDLSVDSYFNWIEAIVSAFDDSLLTTGR
ncbi:metal ABC transporter substrate-binding protein [bacterium]|nr:metal ABC transporter substrate-binding protein [bacterium]